MREIGVRELKDSLSETLRAVGRGQQVRVTVRGKAVADIVPAGAAAMDDPLRGLVAEGRLAAPSRARPRRPPASREISAQRVLTGSFGEGSRALNAYLDASALVKRYIAEPGSDLVREVMESADGWLSVRVGFVETARAVWSGRRTGSSRGLSE